MSLYGTQEIAFQRFGGGLVLDVDPTEIDDDQASDLQNVDLRSYGIDLRKGRAAFNAKAATSSPVNGAHAYYARDGNTRKLIIQAGVSIYEDDGGASPAFEAVATGLSGGVPYDFVQYREVLYGGSSADALRKRKAATGGWSPVSMITAPITPKATNYQPVLENFDSNIPHDTNYTLGWVRTDNNNVMIGTPDPEEKREGTGSLPITFKSGSKGDSLTKRWSDSASVDLSKAEALILWYQANNASATFQIGILPNNPATKLTAAITSNSTVKLAVASTEGYEAGDYVRIANNDGAADEIMKVVSVNAPFELTVLRGQEGTAKANHASGAVVNQAVNFSLFGTFTTVSSDEWVALRVPLAQLPPSRRTASAGIGIKFLTPGKSGFNTVLTFDQCMAEGSLAEDEYSYFATYLESGTGAESNPSPATTLKVEKVPPTFGALLTPAASGEDRVDVIRLWRYRRYGTFRKARLIGTIPNASTTLAAAITTPTTGVAPSTSISVTSAVGISPGCVLKVEDEQMLVREVDGSTLTVQRGYNGTTAATHSTLPVTVTCRDFLDVRSDGAVALEDPEELVSGKINPPRAATYALVNARLLAGNATVDGTAYPWRIYLSRIGLPEEFSSVQEPDKGPAVAGWVDIPSKDHIRRIVELDGQALIFCDRSVWALEGTGWDDFVLRKRADVGLDAREAVVVDGRAVYFLAADGVRVLEPSGGSFEGSFPTWVISEPVDSRLREIPPECRERCAMGIDERGRLHLSLVRKGQTEPDAALIFDPYLPGATLTGQYQPARRGWSYYTGWGFSVFLKLKRGGGDAGQLLGGSAQAAVLDYLGRSRTDADLLTDGTTLDGLIDGSTTFVTVTTTLGIAAGTVLTVGTEQMRVEAVEPSTRVLTVTRGYQGTSAASHSTKAVVTFPIGWHWQSKAADAGLGKSFAWVVISAELDAAAEQTVTATPVLDGAADGTTYPLDLGSASSGYVAVQQRTGARITGRFAALKLSGRHAVSLRVRSARVGLWLRG